jgi:hypothetical protein
MPPRGAGRALSRRASDDRVARAAAPPQRRRRAAKAAAAAPPALHGLPHELVVLIAGHLSGWELSRCVNVCHAWRGALLGAAAAPLWRAALLRDFADGAPGEALALQGALVRTDCLRQFATVPAALRLGGVNRGFKRTAPALRGMHNERGVTGVPRALAAAAGPAPREPRAWACVRIVERVAWRHRLKGDSPPHLQGPLHQGRVAAPQMARAHAALRAWIYGGGAGVLRADKKRGRRGCWQRRAPGAAGAATRHAKADRARGSGINP